jgi:YVTN family beta-propeller protein
MEFRILGPLEVVDGDRPVAVGGPKVRALLAMLLLNRGELVLTDRLIDALWGERAPATAAKTVQVYVSNLRKALGDGVLITQGHGYVLNVDPDQVDVDRFYGLVAKGQAALQSGDPQLAARTLRQALGLWRGPALADLAYEPFAQSEIRRLEDARLAALEDRINAELATGEHTRLVPELEALVHEHPLRERFQAQLMLALYRSGRQADALESYRSARLALVEELGLEPGAALQELERAILAHDPELDPPSQRSGVLPIASARRGQRAPLVLAAGGVLLAIALAVTAVRLADSGARSLLVPANSLAAIDPHTDTVRAFVPVGSRPGPIAVGSGSLWVANVDDQTVSRLNPTSLRTLRTLTLSDPPIGLAATPNAIWVLQSDAQASSVSVRPIDPQFDVVGRGRHVATVAPGDPAAIAAQRGAVWVAPQSGLLTRLDPTTGRPVRQIDPNSGPAAIAIGAGAIWLTDTEANDVTRVDPTGLSTPIAVGDGPSGIAVGAGGVWVADSLDDALVRIDPSSEAVRTTIPVGRTPAGVAVGAGSVWVANSGDGSISRINPRTNKVIATIHVGGSPQAITLAGGRAWVTVDAQAIKPTEGLSRGGTLRIESHLDVDAMDPARAYFFNSWQLLYATCAKLLNYPDKPGLAGSHVTAEVATGLPARSSHGRTYRFTIRHGFRFSPPSNKPVTAQTFKDTIERALNPSMNAPLAYEFADIAGTAAYRAGKAAHISGVVARGDTLTIHLLRPEPEMLARLAQPIFCAVPPNTPVDRRGVRLIPSAGPYYVASYTPGQGVVLVRNPNYHGSRPHRLARIEFSVGTSYRRAVADVGSGTADYTTIVGPGAANLRPLASELAVRYGPNSQAADHGRQQYFVNPQFVVDYFVLNTHRPLFNDARLRRAVSYAIDRRALATLGSPFDPVPDRLTDHYLPPGMPGFTDLRSYPPGGDPARARALVHRSGRTAVLYTCDVPVCAQQAQVLRSDLAAIGLRLRVRAFPVTTMYTRELKPGEPFDIGFGSWGADYPDPAAILGPLLTHGAWIPSFKEPAYQRRLAQTARLSGPRRYLTYGKLDLELARNAAPLIAYGNAANPDFFSARIGCQRYGVYGIDLAALCIKATQH